MPRYMIEETFTGQTMTALLHNPEDRAEAIRPMYEAVGGRLEHYYFSLTENRLFKIVNIPDQADLAAIQIANFTGASLTSYRITPIVTASEVIDVVKKAASVDYRAPRKE